MSVINWSKVRLEWITVEDVVISDAPNFVDAFISEAEFYCYGTGNVFKASESQLEELNQDRELVREEALESLRWV